MNSPRMGGGSIPSPPEVMTPGTGTDPFPQAPYRGNPVSRAAVASDMSGLVISPNGTPNNGSPGPPQEKHSSFMDRANLQIA